jgi:CBS domain-containing protein
MVRGWERTIPEPQCVKIARGTAAAAHQSSWQVADVTTLDVVTATGIENLYDVVEKMQSHGARQLPVVNSAGGLEGVVTLDDVVEQLSEELTDLASWSRGSRGANDPASDRDWPAARSCVGGDAVSAAFRTPA